MKCLINILNRVYKACARDFADSQTIIRARLNIDITLVPTVLITVNFAWKVSIIELMLADAGRHFNDGSTALALVQTVVCDRTWHV